LTTQRVRGDAIFECVPNISEGRDLATIDACAQAIVCAGAVLAHRTSDAVHHRSVFTFFGDRATAIAASVALAHETSARIDLRTHRGAHPRMGALDVLPFVPMHGASLGDAADVAREAARQIWEQLRVPSFFYGAAAKGDDARTLPIVRSGGFEGLASRAARGFSPDVGNVALHESAGAIAVGARMPLIAFNVVLATGKLEIARRIARTIRESNGGLRTLRALGIALDAGGTQVSCNVTDPDALPLDRLIGVIARAAAREGVSIEGGELIGLVPRAALQTVVARRLGLRSL
jgi:glutamate formiminotransferase